MSEKKALYISPGEKGKSGFEDLEFYQMALEVMAKVHDLSKKLPPEEKFDLFSQIRRSSKSVTANIAEGYGRYHYLEPAGLFDCPRGVERNTRAFDQRQSAQIP